MSENNNIMSLEGQLVGMPLAGPESFSQQQLDYLKRALGVDETVLFEETNYTYGTDSVTLSEKYTNFECIKIFTSKGNVQFYYPDNQQGVKLFTLTNITNGFLWLIPWTFQTDGVTFSGATGKLWTVGTTTMVDVPNNAGANRWIQPVKIVGIHRIAGGN